jgi:hypothetical protein
MRNGPDIRIKAWRDRDATLNAEAGRDGAPPACRAPIWSWRQYRSWTIRLGQDLTAPAPSPRRGPRATARQRAYIVDLRRRTKLEMGAPLPAALTIAEASAMIDRLRAAL